MRFALRIFERVRVGRHPYLTKLISSRFVLIAKCKKKEKRTPWWGPCG